MKSNELTIGEVMERLKIDFFPNPSNQLERLCSERELGIKQYIVIAHEMVMQHIDYRNALEGRIRHWIDDRIYNHIKNLSEYIDLLAKELDKERIIGHCSQQSKFLFTAFDPDFTFLLFNSVHSSIISDIMWSGDISVEDAVDLAAGKLDLETLGKYLPEKIKFIKSEFLPYLKNSKYSRHTEAINEVLQCEKKGLNRACNLLLLTTIEGLVRDLAEFLNEQQELNTDLKHEKFNSLDSLLRNGNWKEDFEISRTDLEMLQQSKPPYVVNYSIPIDFERVGTIGEPKIKINLKTRLDFLRRRFKEDRDMILHGQYSEYGSNWHLYVNFSCLQQVMRTLKDYDKLYA